MPDLSATGMKIGTLPIVSVGRDGALLGSRRRALQPAGLEVTSLAPEEAEAMAHETQARLWILCGTVEPSTLVYLACAIRRHSPKSRLLLVEHRIPAGTESSLFHQILPQDSNASLLTAVVHELSVAA